jgi:DNA-binding NarL/FixJ family response regulator
MTRVYVADALTKERSALRLLLLDLNMEVVGEAVDWLTIIANAPATGPDMLLMDWALLPMKMGPESLINLRTLCPQEMVVVMLSNANAHQPTVRATGGDIFIRKSDLTERVVERLQWAAAIQPFG